MLSTRILATPILALPILMGLTGCDWGGNQLAGGVRANIFTGQENAVTVNGPFQFDQEWTTVIFNDPLRVNKTAGQTFGIVLDSGQYQPQVLAVDDDNKAKLNELTPVGVKAWLPQIRDGGEIIKPEVELITSQGEKVGVGITGITYLGGGAHAPISYNYGDISGLKEPPADYQGGFPPDHRYQAVRIRTDKTFKAYFLAWFSVPEDPIDKVEQGDTSSHK